MNARLKSWILFGAVIFCGLIVFTVEYVLKRDPIFGISLLIIGVFGWVVAEIRLEMQKNQ